MPSITDLQANIKAWADSVFPHRTAHGALCKLVLEEIPEFCLDTKSEDEYADLLILLLDVATLNGIDVEGAVTRKMAKNRKRTWVINKETGMMRHDVRTEIEAVITIANGSVFDTASPPGSWARELAARGTQAPRISYRCWTCHWSGHEPSISDASEEEIVNGEVIVNRKHLLLCPKCNTQLEKRK